MNDLNNKIVVIDKVPVAKLVVMDDVVYVFRLPACSIGTHLMVLSMLREQGYKAK